MRSLSRVVVLLHQVVPRPERHQMGVVSGSWDTNRASAAHVGMTELVGELLELIGIKVVVIPQHVVVAGSAGALQGEKIVNSIWNGMRPKLSNLVQSTNIVAVCNGLD